jgi:serine/threonine protein kinase
MPFQSTDNNLLFGFLALQNNFIPREELIAAVSVWLTDKSRSLDEVLRERRTLADDEHELLVALVRKHLQKHGNNAEHSLAALSSVGDVGDDLKKLGDADVEASLLHVAAARNVQPNDPNATLPVDPSTVERTRFRILRPHAEGGLGQVFVARDEELNREVALKEIKFNRSDDSDSRSRFVLEAEITGGLEHPGIVPVYGLGQYADGRPYYAMRFIRGDSLKEAIEQFHTRRVGVPPAQKAPLPLGESGERSSQGEGAQKSGPVFDSVEFRQLLGRFIDVCNAIEYAHSRGVLHRDLKPGNIMLGKYGETLVVDWGLAKAKERDVRHQQSDEHTLQPRSSSGSSATQMGSAIGTPAFMSPEQAAGRLDILGPASDVYSLGATLYSVLTGQLAFAKGDTGEILHRVQNGDFPPPRQICPKVPQPLEAICLKAMALKPSDRYSSPQALAEDLERYLADEPIRALSEPLSIRTRRWLRKHPRSVAALAATLLMLLASSAVVSTVVATTNRQVAAVNNSLKEALVSQREATTQAEHRQKEAELARKVAEFAKWAAETARQESDLARSNEELARAQEQLTGIYFKQIALDLAMIVRNPELDQADRQSALVSILRQRIEYMRKSAAGTPEAIADVLNSMAAAYAALDLHAEAAGFLEEARELLGEDHPRTLEFSGSLGNAYGRSGNHDKALMILENTIERQKSKLGADNTITLGTAVSLAEEYVWREKFDKALPLYEHTLDLASAHADEYPEFIASIEETFRNACQSFGKTADGRTQMQQSLQLADKRWGPNHPVTLVYVTSLANSYYAAAETDKAILLLESAIERCREKGDVALLPALRHMHSLAVFQISSGKAVKAVELLEKPVQQMRTPLVDQLRMIGPVLFQEARTSITCLDEVVTLQRDLANAYLALQRPSEALPLFEEITQFDPKNIEAFNHLAWLRATCPDKQYRNGQQAIEYATKACQLTNWKNSWYFDTLAAAYAETGDFTNAVEWQKKALDGSDATMADEFRTRLELYKSSQPYREPPPSPPTPPTTSDSPSPN